MSLYPVDTILPDGSKYPGMDPDTGKFTSGDAQAGIKASAMPASIINLLLDNMGELIDFGVGSSNPADTDQVKKAVQNIVAPVGKLYTQHPFMPTPDVFYGGLGTWENISARAVGYGISDVNEGEPTSYISREDAGQGMDFADSDLAVDDAIVSGAHAGMYVRTVETYEGLFFRVEGGNAEVFEQAHQEDAIQHITGGFSVSTASVYGDGVFSPGIGPAASNRLIGDGAAGTQRITFDNSKSTTPNLAKTDDYETRSINRTNRIWIRTA